MSPGEFDGVMIPVGALNSDFLRVVPKAQEFVKKINSAGKPMAVICHAKLCEYVQHLAIKSL